MKLAYHDGSPVQDSTNRVTVRYGFTYDQSLYVEEKYKLSKDGLVELNFYPPNDSNQTVLGIEVSIKFSIYNSRIFLVKLNLSVFQIIVMKMGESNN